MRRRLARTLAVIGCVTLVAVPATTSLAGHLPYQGSDDSYDSGDWVKYNYEGTIPAGWPSHYYAEDAGCVPQDGCPALEDVSYTDVDISEPMQAYESEAQFSLANGLYSTTTVWMVCSYDSSGETIRCHNDGHWGWGLLGNIHPDARELRLFPSKSAANTWHLTVFVD